MSDNVLVARKKVSQFIEKQFRYFDFDFSHDDYKRVCYQEASYNTPVIEKLKAYYDAYMYLLDNAKNPLTKGIINKFYYLLFEEELNDYKVCLLETYLMEISEYSIVEKACEFHIYVYDKLSFLSLSDRQVISLMFLNYILVKYDIPSIKLVYREINEYVELRDNYKNNKESLVLFINNIIKNSFVLEKSYIENLEPLNISDVYNKLVLIKEELKEKYNVLNVYIYGSFSKEMNRIDSDIDLLVRLKYDLTYEKRVKIIEELKEYLFNIFKRFTDIEEVREFFSDDFIKEATKIKKVF